MAGLLVVNAKCSLKAKCPILKRLCSGREAPNGLLVRLAPAFQVGNPHVRFLRTQYKVSPHSGFPIGTTAKEYDPVLVSIDFRLPSPARETEQVGQRLGSITENVGRWGTAVER